MRTQLAKGGYGTPAAYTATLNQASNADSRKPVARLTLRNTLLRFNQTPLAIPAPANPWLMDGAQQINGEDLCAGAALALSNSVIVRVWVSTYNGQTATIRINRVSAPAVAASWNVWTDTGITADANSNPGLGEYAGNLYLFYTVAGAVFYKTQAITGGAWSAAVATTLTITGGPITLAVTHLSAGDFRVFACAAVNGAIRVYALLSAGSWTKYERPWFQDGNATHAISASSFDSVMFFDAFELNGRTFHIYSWGPTGECWIGEWALGVWGNPTVMLPNDYSHFHPYRATVIQGKVWLTGRIERRNEANWSPAWDTYLYSADGINWTATPRDSFLTADVVRGKLILPSAGSGAVYYAGLGEVISAPATWLIDPQFDNSAYQIVVGNANQANWHDTADFNGQTVYPDLMAAQASFPASGTAPTLTLDLANGDESWYWNTDAAGATTNKLDLLKPDAELTLDLGYQTGNTLEEYVTVLQGSLDTFGVHNGLGERTLQLQARDSLYKRLKDYNSLYYWPLQSQLKHYDSCDQLDSLAVVSAGTWVASSPNLVVNPGFEGGTGAYGEYVTMPSGWDTRGTGAGTIQPWKDSTGFSSRNGDYSCRFEKTHTGGGFLDTLRMIQGMYTPTGGGATFSATAWVNIESLNGGNGTLTLRVKGDGVMTDPAATGVASVPGPVTDTHLNPVSDPGSGSDWIQFHLTFQNPTGQVVTIELEFTSVDYGVIYVDDFDLSSTDRQITFNDIGVDGVMVSTDPASTVDFDIQGSWLLKSSGQPAAQVGMGLVGCLVDKSNFILYQLERNATTGVYQLALYRKRAGVYTLFPGATYAYAWVTNVLYDLRLVHRQGHFWCYFKQRSATDWVGPIFTSAGYDHVVWDPVVQGGPVIPSDDGQGQVGVRAYRHSMSFTAAAVDELARVVPLAASSDATHSPDWPNWPTSGTINWSGEKCSFSRRTPASIVYAIRQNSWGEEDYRHWLDPGVNTVPDQWTPAKWGWFFQLNQLRNQDDTADVAVGSIANFATTGLGVTDMAADSHDVPKAGVPSTTGGYALIFGSRQINKPYAGWEILMCKNMLAHPESCPPGSDCWKFGKHDGVTGIRVSGTGGVPFDGTNWNAAWLTWAGASDNLESGYRAAFGAFLAQTAPGGPGGKMVRADGIVDVKLAPCLGNVKRGPNAGAHNYGETVYLWSDDVPSLFEFHAHDLATDWNTEQLLARSCALAGVLATSFGDAYTSASLVLGGGGAWAVSGGLADTAGTTLARVNVDFTWQVPALANNQGCGLQFHADGAGVGGHTVLLQRDGSGINWCEYRTGTPGGSLVERFKIAQVPTGGTWQVRLLVTAEWVTVYVNGACLGNFHQVSQLADPGTDLRLWSRGPITLSNVRLPELDEWREALRVDTNANIESFIGLVTEDRPIFSISRSGQSVYFSSFTTRTLLTRQDTVLAPGVTPGVNDYFETRLLDDEAQITDNERYSFSRVEAVGILEFLNSALAAANGFIMKQQHMNKADNTLADRMTARALQLMQEGLLVGTVQMAFNPRFETEDGFNTHYVDPATGTVLGRQLIVNDIQIQYDDQGLNMQIGARQRMNQL